MMIAQLKNDRFLVLGLVFLMMLSLIGCAQTPRPAVEVRTVEVIKPVPVACVDAKAVPAEPATLHPSGAVDQMLDQVTAKALELRAWGKRLMGLVGPCIQP